MKLTIHQRYVFHIMAWIAAYFAMCAAMVYGMDMSDWTLGTRIAWWLTWWGLTHIWLWLAFNKAP